MRSLRLPQPRIQGRLLHWSIDAACILEKNEGERKSCIFSWKFGGEIKGGERINYLSIYFHCLLLFSQKFSRSLRSLDYILFSSPNQGTWKVRLTLKNGMEKRQFSVLHFWWPDVTKLITQNLNETPGPQNWGGGKSTSPWRARTPSHLLSELPWPLPPIRCPNMQRDFTNPSYIYILKIYIYFLVLLLLADS